MLAWDAELFLNKLQLSLSRCMKSWKLLHLAKGKEEKLV